MIDHLKSTEESEMRISSNKIATLFIVPIIALAGIGTAYACWWEYLPFEGQVETAYLCTEWTSIFNFDPNIPGIVSLDPNSDGSRKDKDVGWTDVEIDPDDPSILHVTINNAYPSYFNDLEIEWINCGSIPIHIYRIDIIPIGGWQLASAEGADDGPIWIRIVDGIGSQIHPFPDEIYDVAHSFKIHVEQSAEQGATYQFDIKIIYVQWNEDPCDEIPPPGQV
jgi:hypothetical protein